MTTYFQHVGEAGGTRDFPRTIGTPTAGLIEFSYSDVAPFLEHLPVSEREQIRIDVEKYASDKFQIWGIPSGAKFVLRAFEVGDYLLLLEAAGSGGSFAYVGRAIGKPSRECFDLSEHLWGEQRFPLIVFLRGHLTNYEWPTFCRNAGYKPNWNPAGQTYRISYERLSVSAFGDEDGLVHAMAGQSIPLIPTEIVGDRILQDPVELDFQDAEGLLLLRQHLQRERSARLIQAFKRQLQDVSCCVCGFDFHKAYGELGRVFIEAHHTKPVAQLDANEVVSVRDLVPVCSNCHRMIHRQHPTLTWQALKELWAARFLG